MNYKTIIGEGIYEFEEKKSVFIGYSKHVDTEDEAKEFIQIIKRKHGDARHNVYGYVIGDKMLIQRYTDDGEPQGTAGIPIIEVIKKNELTNIVIVVTRYFGGVLLGASGLTRAYVKSADGAIKNSNVVRGVLGKEIRITVGYELIGKLQYFFNDKNIDIKDTLYAENVTLIVRCETDNVEHFIDDVTNLTFNNFHVEISSDVMYFKNKDKYFLYSEFQ